MFSKAESQALKKEFWTAFANEYPRKWLLYNTRIKDVSLKFYADNKTAQVLLDIEPKEEEKRIVYFEKMVSLQTILREEFLPDAVYEQNYYLENGKTISRVWVEKTGISLYNKATWQDIFDFFYEKMDAFERFFYEYEDYIRDLDINT
ncbi:DUF4268 domain-containing protein [Flavobacterium rhizosphaerae]|uniref:DUF4268 domain-containing protein n=1 Tax=Flavobacterium rhizosphaerae TaxID=3163298 RepID=A0ABW8Z000_9FLAO